MVYGYARVSTYKQSLGNSLEEQKEILKKLGAEKIIEEVYTGSTTKRPQLDLLLQEIKQGDTLIITKLDRIARSIIDGKNIIETLINKNVKVIISNLGGTLDNSPVGKLLLNVLFAFAEFERDLIIERTQAGKSIARTKNRYREGRPPKHTKEQYDHAFELLKTHIYKEVEKMTKIKIRILYNKRAKRHAKGLL